MIDIREPLNKGDILKTDFADIVIYREIGRGSSGIVYEGYYFDSENNKHTVRIKELMPWNCNPIRKSNKNIQIPIDKEDEFQTAKNYFTNSYNINVEFRNTPGFVNSTVDSMGKYALNGTLYYVMGADEGCDYSHGCDSDLQSVFERTLTLCKLVKQYHDKGLLLLDIKPENIFVIPETTELVKFFDFDSVIEKDALYKNENVRISFSQGCAAYELKTGNRSLISEGTDIFSIGAVVFWKIFRRYPTVRECAVFYEYDFSKMSFGDFQYNPKLYDKLSDFMHKTLSHSIKLRYKSIDEMCDALEQLIELSDMERNYIITSSIPENKNFIGRERELEDIHNALKNDHIVLLSGVGGVGKTELARNYISKYNTNYDAIIFAPYVLDIKSMINDDSIVAINNFRASDSDNENDFFWMKMRKLKDICDSKVLFVIDNMTNFNDENFGKLLELGCKFLITTRKECSQLPYKFFECGVLPLVTAKNLFFKYYTRRIDDNDDKIIEDILRFINCHTYTIELLAKQMSVSRISPKEMFEKLKKGIVLETKEKIVQNKDGMIVSGSVADHIETLFDFSSMQDDLTIKVLRNAALVISGAGIDIEDFKKLNELSNYEIINQLIDNGWFFDRGDDKVFVHPIVSELLARKYKPDVEKCKNAIDYLLDRLNSCLKENILNRQECSEVLQYVSFAANRLICNQGTNEEGIYFLNQTSIFLKKMYVLQEAERIAEWICKHINSVDHKSELEITAYKNYADIKLSMKQYIAAESYYLKSLSLSLQEYGKTAPYVAKLYNDIGKVYNACGDVDLAVIYLLRAFAIRLELVRNSGGVSKDLLDDMGLLYFDLLNDRNIMKYYKVEIVGQYKLLLGHSTHDLITNICNMPQIITSDVKEKILSYYITSTEARINNYSKFTLDSATAIHNVGVLYDIFDEPGKALEKYFEALSIKTEIMGDEHISCAVTNENIGNNYYYAGDETTANQYYKRAYEIYVDFYGEYSDEAIRIIGKLNN